MRLIAFALAVMLGTPALAQSPPAQIHTPITAFDFTALGVQKQDYGFIATGAVTSRSLPAHFADTLNVLDYGVKCDGATDDTAAFQAALTAAQARGHSVEVVVPDQASCLVGNSSNGLSLTVPANVSISLHASGSNGSQLRFPAGFTSTGLNVTLSTGATLSLSGFQFVHVGTDQGGIAVSVTQSGTGVKPGLDAERLGFLPVTTGGWSNGIAAIGLAGSQVQSIICTTVTTCLSIDTPTGTQSYGHYIANIKAGGGNTAILLGHSSLTGAGVLGGFQVQGVDCEAVPLCISATAQSGALDGLLIRGLHAASGSAGVTLSNVIGAVVTDSYFNGEGSAVADTGGNMLSFTGNVMIGGTPYVAGTPNVALILNNLATNGGASVSGNVFTALGAVPIDLIGSTGYVHVSGNTCIGYKCVADTSSNPTINFSGPNLELNASQGSWIDTGLSISSDIAWGNGTQPAIMSGNGGGGVTLAPSGGGTAVGLTLTGTNSSVNVPIGDFATLNVSANATIAGSEAVTGTLSSNGYTNTSNESIGGTDTITGQVTAGLLVDNDPNSPASQTSACQKGRISYSASKLYLCSATNYWIAFTGSTTVP